MNIKIHSAGFTADQKLVGFIQDKMQRLGTFYDKIIDVDVFLKLDCHAKIRDKVVEVRTNVPGSTLFAENTAMSFENATVDVFETVKKQLSKKKELSKGF